MRFVLRMLPASSSQMSPKAEGLPCAFILFRLLSLPQVFPLLTEMTTSHFAPAVIKHSDKGRLREKAVLLLRNTAHHSSAKQEDSLVKLHPRQRAEREWMPAARAALSPPQSPSCGPASLNPGFSFGLNSTFLSNTMSYSYLENIDHLPDNWNRFKTFFFTMARNVTHSRTYKNVGLIEP